jgi:uncharacterized protein YpmB
MGECTKTYIYIYIYILYIFLKIIYFILLIVKIALKTYGTLTRSHTQRVASVQSQTQCNATKRLDSCITKFNLQVKYEHQQPKRQRLLFIALTN